MKLTNPPVLALPQAQSPLGSTWRWGQRRADPGLPVTSPLSSGSASQAPELQRWGLSLKKSPNLATSATLGASVSSSGEQGPPFEPPGG